MSNQKNFEDVSSEEPDPDNLTELLVKLGYENVKQDGKKASFVEGSAALKLFLNSKLCD